MNRIPKYRWQLNKDQLEVLGLLYKFRFGSSDLIAQYFGKSSGAFVYKRLRILQEQGFIGKRFDSSYRLRGMPAAYYLRPAGMRKLNELWTSEGKGAVGVERLYKETRVSEAFVRYCLDIFGFYLGLKSRYGDHLRFFTKHQLAGKYAYFEEFTPSVYFRLEIGGAEKDYFLEYLQSSKPFFAIAKRIKEYIEYADSGEWEDDTNSDFPAVLLVCDMPRLQEKLLKDVDNILEDAEDEMPLYVSTQVNSDQWLNLTDPDNKPHSLLSL